MQNSSLNKKLSTFQIFQTKYLRHYDLQSKLSFNDKDIFGQTALYTIAMEETCDFYIYSYDKKQDCLMFSLFDQLLLKAKSPQSRHLNKYLTRALRV